MTTKQVLSSIILFPLLALSAFSVVKSNPAFAESSDKVLVIFSGKGGGDFDVFGAADDVFDADTARASALYKKAGFQVVVLAGSQINSETIQGITDQKKNLSELHFLILAHGTADNNHAFLLATDSVGRYSGADIRDLLKREISDHPGLKIYVSSLSCYGGALGDQLADLPGVFVMPSTGSSEPTLITETSGDLAGDPIKSILTALGSDQTYVSAEDIAWQGQLRSFVDSNWAAFAAEQKRKIEVPMPLRQLPILRTGSELFLETWCANENKEPWASEHFFSLKDSSQEGNIAEELKSQAIEEGLNSTMSRLNKLKALQAKLQCASVVDTDVSDFNSLEISLVKQELGLLKKRINDISVEEYRKIQVEAATKKLKDFNDPQSIHMMNLDGSTPNAPDLQTKIQQMQQLNASALEMDRENALQTISQYENECLQSSVFNPNLNTSIQVVDAGYYGTCKSFPNFFEPIEARFFESKEIVTPNGSFQFTSNNLLSSSLTSQTFQSYERAMVEDLKRHSKSNPFGTASMAIYTDIPDYKDYCDLLGGSIEEYQKDLACENKFKVEASAGAWSRYLDIQTLEQGKLF